MGSGNEDDAMQCMLDNKDSVLITPDQIPLNEMRYELMNYPTQQTIRQLLVAEAKILLGLVRGYASGKISIPNSEMVLDYGMLLDQGKQEKEQTLTELKERLERMLPWNMMKNQSDMVENLTNVLKAKPFQSPFMVR